MDIGKVLEAYDEVERTHDFQKIEEFLLDAVSKASEEKDTSSLISLLNEQIGFYREFSEYQKSVTACRDLLLVLDSAGLAGTVPYATSLLNIANACRAAGLLKESNIYYNEVLKIYDEAFAPTDPAFAPLYNNMALLFQEMGDYMSACDCLSKALAIVQSHPEEQDKIAITHTNLALSLMKNNEYEEAVFHLNEAFRIFDSFEETDYHYGAALSAMGEALFIQRDYEGSVKYYERALSEIKKNTGRSRAYEITLQNLCAGLRKIRDREGYEKKYENGLDLARQYYETYGAPMIRERFPAYEKRIAAGLVGEGSECYGYDDEHSADHDFGPGFCLWLTEEDYEAIGEELKDAYDDLPPVFLDTARLTMHEASQRVGVFRIGDFYENLAGFRDIPDSENTWLFVTDEQLSKVTNGAVFRDDLGEFTRIREGLKSYYPEDVHLRKLAYAASMFSQYGQYNYPRMLGRGDLVSAQICLAHFTEEALKLLHLIRKTYAPFYKWLFKSGENLDPRVTGLLKQIASLPVTDERILTLIDETATGIYDDLKKLGLVSAGDNYLDHHKGEILSRIPGKNDTDVKDRLMETLIRLEWNAFDKTVNEGGRASCQDDWNTFYAMRKSQYLTWTDEMLESFIDDFQRANERGWNLITEKYGRMEESTAPEEYAKIRDAFPEISPEKKAIIEQIVAIQTGMMEEFAKEYPKAAGEARVIHTYEDTPYDTSYETYLRGEVSTYSDRTLVLYGRFLASLAREGKNLAKMIITNSALLYGYASLDDMESKL